MILAPNRLLQSNGSKLLYLLFVIVLLAGCSSTKSSTSKKRPKVIRPSTEKVDKPTTPKEEESKVLAMDTVRWTEISEDVFPPITSASEDYELNMVRKKKYEVALLLPLRLTDYDITDLDANNRKFASFYAGLKRAAETNNTDLDVRITTYDTNRDEAQIDRIISSWRGAKPDVIVGPYITKGLKKMASFAKANGIALISPWRASTSVTNDNLYYLQMRPNVTAYYDAILADMTSKHDRERIAIIKNANGAHDNMVKYIQKANQEKSNVPLSKAIREITLPQDTLLQSDSLVFASVLDDVDVFFLPQFNTSKDEDFVYGCLRKLNAEKGNRDISIYLMPLALNNDRIDLSILKSLKLRFCEYKFPDKRNPSLSQFNRGYYNEYGRLPDADSYYGFDFMNFMIKGLEKYGQYFHYYMKDETVDMDQMSISVRPYYNSSDDLLYMMNNSFYFIEFEDNRFVPHKID